MRRGDGSTVRGTTCGTALVFAEEIHRSVNVNRETLFAVAVRLGLTVRQVGSVARITRFFRGAPSPERLALIVMQAPDIEDEDIAAWFGRPTGWAKNVRRYGEDIAKNEYIPARIAWVADEWEPGDPTPEEIRERAAEVRARWERKPAYTPVTATFMRWQGGKIGAFFQVQP